MKKRKRIPKHIKTRLLTESRRRCCLCVFFNKDYGLKKIQISHIDRNTLNVDYDNLVVLCLEHHEMYDSKTSVSLSITPEEIRHWKNLLTRANEIDLPIFNQQINSIPDILKPETDVIANLLFLLLLDQYSNGAWGYSLASTSDAYGRIEDPGSITVSYWACCAIKSIVKETDLPEFQKFDSFLLDRYKANGSVGLRKNIGSDWVPAYEIIENRRHTAMAYAWWRKFGHALDKSMASLKYLAETRTPTGAWSAVGDITDGNADPLTTSYVLRALIDAEKDGLLAEIDFSGAKSFIGTYRKLGFAWLYSNLLDSDLWWIYRPKDKPLQEVKLSQSYRFTADVLLALPEFLTEDRTFADAHATIMNNMGALWRKYEVGIPSGIADELPTLSTTAKFTLAVWRCRERYPQLASEFIPRFIRDLDRLLESGHSDSSGWALTITLLDEIFNGFNFFPTTIHLLRTLASNIWAAQKAEDKKVLNNLFLKQVKWAKAIAIEKILNIKLLFRNKYK